MNSISIHDQNSLEVVTGPGIECSFTRMDDCGMYHLHSIRAG